MADVNFGWNDFIADDGNEQEELIVLPEGDYDFKVVEFTRAKSKAGANMAKLMYRVETDKGTALIHEYIVLTSKQEWKISAFFRCIGQKKRGERVAMDWSKVQGATGRAHVIVEPYTKADGSEGKSNKVSRYIDWSEANKSAVKFADDIQGEVLMDDEPMPWEDL